MKKLYRFNITDTIIECKVFKENEKVFIVQWEDSEKEIIPKIEVDKIKGVYSIISTSKEKLKQLISKRIDEEVEFHKKRIKEIKERKECINKF